MEEKKKKGGLGLQQTSGTFQMRGTVSGVEKDNFYKDTTTKTGKPFRSINFAVEYASNKKLFTGFNGMERDFVYYSKTEKDESGKNKTTVEKVKWDDRHIFSKEGYRLIGVNVGLEQKNDDNGGKRNDNKTFPEFDACEYIADHLNDDDDVFVKGNIEYSTYKDRRQVKFVPTQISKCRKPVDFESDDFEPCANFTQTIVFTGIAPNEDKTVFTVSAKIISYNAVEDAEFEVHDPQLANQMRKALKPYNAITVHGDIIVSENIEAVEKNDGWGSANKMNRVGSPYTRTLVITGADPDTLDTTTYSEDMIDEAVAKLKAAEVAAVDYGKAPAWGSAGIDDDEDESWG